MANNSGGKAATKSEIYQKISEATSLSRKQIASVFDALGELIQSELGKKGPGLGCPIWSDFEPLFSCWFWALVHVTGTGRSQHCSLFLLRG